MFTRARVASVVAEFLGVVVLTLAVLAVAKSQIGFPIFIALAAGLVYAGLYLAFGRANSAQFNPAVTLGLWTIRKVPTVPAIVAIVAQFLGAFAGWKLYEYLTGKALTNSAAKEFDIKVLVAEVVGTFLFVFCFAAVAHKVQEEVATAVALASALAVAILIASIASNGLVNPALAVGVQSIDKSYLIGPFIGGIIGANLYGLLFAPIVRNNNAAAAARTLATDAEPVATPKTKKVVGTKAAAGTSKRKPAARKVAAVKKPTAKRNSRKNS